jgi:hypothetical protein
MGRSRSRSYSPTFMRRERSRSPFRRSRRRDMDDGGAARRKSWRARELSGRYSSAPTSLLVRNIARDSRHSHPTPESPYFCFSKCDRINITSHSHRIHIVYMSLYLSHSHLIYRVYKRSGNRPAVQLGF